MIGARYGYQVVIAAAEKNKHGQPCWLVRCDCGNERVVSGCMLRKKRNAVIACRDCFIRRNLGKPRHYKHGHASTEGVRSRTYETWLAMNTRCHRETAADYDRYGGRGIRVCDRWRESFEAFLADMGERPVGMTLDRKDNDLGYFKENCKWSSASEQIRNRRTSKLTLAMATEAIGRVEHGETHAAVARRLGVTPSMVTAIVHGKCWAELQPFSPSP